MHSPTNDEAQGASTGSLATALALLGSRWALLVVHELLLGPRRFTDLRLAISGVSAAVLHRRLLELQEAGVVQRKKLPRPASVWVYELTDSGRALEAAVGALKRWAASRDVRWRQTEPGMNCR